MGKYDVAVNRLLERKKIFADLQNGTVFGGRQVLKPEKLELISEKAGMICEENGKKSVIERRGDIRMKADMGTYSVIVANESQQNVHYAMPVRNMLYDALEYTKQVQELEKKHREEGEHLKRGEFLSGIKKSDKLNPVVTTVLYLGSGKEWDGSKSLHEMLNIDGEDENAKILREYLPDYKINLIQGNHIENPEVFQTCLQYIFSMLKYNKDKQKLYQYVQSHRKDMRKMDDVEMTAALVLLGEQKRLLSLMDSKEEEETDMCDAITELIEDGRAEGKAGEIQIIRRKLHKGLSVEEIAEWTELEKSYVWEIQKLDEKYPEYTDVQIAGEYLNNIKD